MSKHTKSKGKAKHASSSSAQGRRHPRAVVDDDAASVEDAVAASSAVASPALASSSPMLSIAIISISVDIFLRCAMFYVLASAFGVIDGLAYGIAAFVCVRLLVVGFVRGTVWMMGFVSDGAGTAAQ